MDVRRDERARRRTSEASSDRDCPSCGVDWPGSARFCGWCGANLTPDLRGPRASGSGTPGGDPDARTAARRLLVLLAVIALVGLALTAARLTEVEDGAPADTTDEVDVPPPPDRPADGTDADEGRTPIELDEPPATCTFGGREPVGCGVPLFAGTVGRRAISPLPPNTVVVADDGVIRRFDLPSGAPTWETVPFAGATNLTIRASAEGVAVSRPGEVAWLDTRDGELRWRVELPARGAPRTWPVDGDVYVLTSDRVLMALDGATGGTRWSLPDVSPDVVPTTDGILLTQAGRLGLWRDDEEPVWTLPDVALSARRLPGGRPTSSPVRLLGGREVLLPATAEVVDVRDGAPVGVTVLDGLTVVLRWPDDGRLQVRALGEGGELLWERDDLDLRCCLATAVPVSDGRMVIGGPEGELLLLDRTSGRTIEELERQGAAFAGVAGDLVLWNEVGQLVGVSMRTGRQVLQTSGTVRSLDPLLIAGPEGVFHVSPRWFRPMAPRPHVHEPAII